jgi:hypothetical protein
MNASSSGIYSGSITHNSTGAAQQTVAVSGNAMAAEPTSPSSLTFGTIGMNGIQANFTGGSGANRIVVVAPAAVTFTPVDGASASGVNSDYSLAADQGAQNKIVYNGNGNTVSVTGLSSNTVYYFAVYEYNGSGTLTNYLTSSFATGNATTLASEPTLTSTVTLVRLSIDSMFVSFAGGNGTRRMVILHNSVPVSFVPTDGSTYSGSNTTIGAAADLGGGDLFIYDGTATSVGLKGFNPATTYYISVFEYNGTGIQSNFMSTAGSTSVATYSYPVFNRNLFSKF